MFGSNTYEDKPSPRVENYTFHSDGLEDRIDTPDGYDGLSYAEPEHEYDTDQYDGLHKRLISYYAQELYVQESQRREMKEDEAFFDGDQWDEKDKAVLQSRGQLPLVYNVIASAVNWLLGTQRRGRAQFKVLPRKKTGSQPAERKTQLMKYIGDANREEYHMSRAFADAVRVGIGWLECGHQDETRREPVYSRYENWRNILWDSRSGELDMSDARFIFRAKWADLDTAMKKFPDRRDIVERAKFQNMDLGAQMLDGWSDEAMDEAETTLQSHYEHNTGSGHYERHRVRLIECWYKTPEPTDFIKGGEFTGEVFDPYHAGHVDAVNADEGASIVSRIKMRVRVAIFTNTGLLYEGISPYNHNEYPFTPIWGNRRGSDGMPYGLIRNMKDIQRDINKRASKALHIMSSSKIIMDDGAVQDIDELAEEAAQSDAIIVKKKGYELKLDQDRALAAPHLELMSRDITMIQQQSGITDEAMGRSTNATSGKAIVARQNQGSVAIAHFLDNLRFARQIHGEKQLSLIEQYFSEEKAFRITNSRGSPEYVSVNDGEEMNDIVRTKADFVISDDDWKATMRQAEVEELMKTLRELAPANPQVVMVLLDLVVDAMDIPSKDEIVARIRQLTGMEDPDSEQDPNDPEVQAKAMAKQAEAEAANRAKEAEISGMEATAQEKQAKARKAAADADKVERSVTKENLEQVETALKAALSMIQNRAAVPLADQMIAEAKGELAAAQPQQQPTLPPQMIPEGA